MINVIYCRQSDIIMKHHFSLPNMWFFIAEGASFECKIDISYEISLINDFQLMPLLTRFLSYAAAVRLKGNNERLRVREPFFKV